MFLGQLKDIIDNVIENNDNAKYLDVEVVIVDNSLGVTPTSEIKSAAIGFDWDNGKFLLHPKDRLTKKL